MAYMSQERKAKIAPVVRAICQRYGVKASLSVQNHSTLALTVRQGSIDFIGNFNETVQERDPTGSRRIQTAEKNLDVNPYWYQDHFTGTAKQFLSEVLAAMNEGNHDRSDIRSDYFDVGWYVNVYIGRWDRPYALVK